MPQLIDAPTTVACVGSPPKTIEEFVGHVNTKSSEISVAKMISPPGWSEPGQTPEFLEISVVIRGKLHVEHADGSLRVGAGQAVIARPGEWVRYSTPGGEETEYVAICLPAFSPNTVHRDSDL